MQRQPPFQHGRGAGSGGGRGGICFNVSSGSEAQLCRSHARSSSLNKALDCLRDAILEALRNQNEEIRAQKFRPRISRWARLRPRSRWSSRGDLIPFSLLDVEDLKQEMR